MIERLEQISSWVIPGMPEIRQGDSVGKIIVDKLRELGIELKEGDIIAVASKAVSYAEGRIMNLEDITPTNTAHEIHNKIPRKNPRVVQAMIDETGDPTGSRLTIDGDHIRGKLPNGLSLTSAGIDKINDGAIALLPKNPDESARVIGSTIMDNLSTRVGVLITDSDGRADRAGATQVCIGIYGVPPLRAGEYKKEDNTIGKTEETICDMLAAAAGLHMGQRGTNKPVVVIRGYPFEYDPDASMEQVLHK